MPMLRDRFLNGSDEILRGYSATILGQIALDSQNQAFQGLLSAATQQRAIADLETVAALMTSGPHQFNAEPVNHVTTALKVLRQLQLPPETPVKQGQT